MRAILPFTVTALHILLATYTPALWAQESAPASFQASLAPWKSASGDLANRVSFAGVATIGVQGNTNGLTVNLIEPLILCDGTNSFRAEFRPRGDGSVSATIRVGRELPYLVNVPVQVGGARPDADSFLWIEQSARGVTGVARVSAATVIYYAAASGARNEYRGPVVFETQFQAAPWQERIRQGAGSAENFSRMSPHQRLPVVQWASCGTSPPSPPAQVTGNRASPDQVAASQQATEERSDRWYARCATEWTSAQGPRDRYLARCRCTTDVLAATPRYLQPEESAGLELEFWQTVARIMERGRRPAVYVTQARCSG